MLGTSQAHRIETRADLAQAIILAEQAGAIGTARLMRALYRGEIAFLPLYPDTTSATFKAFASLTRGRPAVILIGDDDYQERGPAGWPISRRAIRWAASVLLHAAGAEREHYESAILAAQVIHRVLVVECSTTTLPLWQAAIAASPNRPGGLVIAPTNGAHPVTPQRGKMQ